VEQSPPSETASLQRLVRQEDLKKTAAFFAERASAVAASVVYLPDRKSSGLYWTDPKGIVVPAVGSDPLAPPLALLRGVDSETPSPPYSISEGAGRGRWLLLVGRAPDSALIWTAAMEGGARPASCDGIEYRELAIGTQLNASMAGFAAVDLDGDLAGMVLRCGESYHVIAASSIGPMLRSLRAPERMLRTGFGIRTEPLDPRLAKHFRGGTGLLLVEIWKPALAYRVGLRAGDLLVSVNTVPVSSASDLWSQVYDGAGSGSRKILAMRGAKRIEIDLVAPPEPDGPSRPLGIDVITSPQTLLIDPHGEAHRIGLRTGDRIVQAGSLRHPTAEQIRRILDPTRLPALLVFERGFRQIAMVIAK
jgi:hypothetical protein